MSLSTQERRALHSIEEDLSGSDPGLVSLLATFTRLAQDEEMPGYEQIGSGGKPRGHHRPQAGRYGRPGPAWRARMLSQPPNLHRAGLLLWLVISICLVAVALAVNRNNGGARTCMDPWIAACSAPARTHPLGKPSWQPASALLAGQAPGEQVARDLGLG
jgi:hypothetical protein